MSQGKVLAAIKSIEQRQNKREGSERRSCQESEGTGKELNPVQHAPRKEPEKASDRLDNYFHESRAAKQKLDAVPSVSEIIMRLLVLLPFMGSHDQQAATGFERSKQLGDHSRRILNVLESNNIDARIEGTGPKGQRGKICDRIQIAIIPGSISDSQVDAHVAVSVEQLCILSFPGAGIKNKCVSCNFCGETSHCRLDCTFKVENIPLKPDRHNAERRGHVPADHPFFRASTMMVDPARQAASSAVTGTAVITRAK
jgi:hypothetical protein